MLAVGGARLRKAPIGVVQRDFKTADLASAADGSAGGCESVEGSQPVSRPTSASKLADFSGLLAATMPG